MNKPSPRWLSTSALVLVFALAVLRATFLPGFDVERPIPLQTAVWEIPFWLLAIALMGISIGREKLFPAFLAGWRRNPFLALFIVFAIASIGWSVWPWMTACRTVVLLCASLAGAYLGTRYDSVRLAGILAGVGAILLLACAETAVLFPSFGRMFWTPYDGAWRGIFWHKNYLGSILALFNAVFLLRSISGLQAHKRQAILDGVLYLASLVVIYLADSAAGYIVTIVLHACVIGAAAWLRVRQRMRPVHYYILAGVFVTALALILWNLDFVFGLFNRSSTLTGRVPLWNYLLADVVGQRPWLGYGFGAYWNLDSFRLAAQQAVGWGYPVAIADNGFLDILLHLGIPGLALFLGAFLTGLARAVRYALRLRTLESFLPLIILIFTVFANLSFSLFLESDALLWVLMAAAFFVSPSSVSVASDVKWLKALPPSHQDTKTG
jgi:exopolysaccharide production protein ExoQ